jgi:formate hydrogenlyase transcriptional activator
MKDTKLNQPDDNTQEWAGAAKLLQFEQLLFEISATYINLPGNQIEEVIRGDLGRLGRFLGADFCCFFFLREETRQATFDTPFSWWAEELDALYRKISESKSQPTFEYFFECCLEERVVKFSYVEELAKETERVSEAFRSIGVKSLVSVPVSVSGRVVGGLLISTIHTHRIWPDELIPRLRLVGEVFANSMARKHWEDSLEAALTEIRELKAKIEADYHFLKEETNLGIDFQGTVGKSEALRKIMTQVGQVAPTNVTVLILGETGTGKGFMARTLHNASGRRDRPFMQVNCAALAPTLIESEFFGHEKGAFTGAQSRRIGWFEKAKGTTLFLDEIGELSLEVQAKLLRVLQEGEFERVGGSDTVKTDVRIIAATNRDIEKEAEAGRFRKDLWYRLTVFPIFIPPLRDRPEDIPLFVNAFVDKHVKTIGKSFERITRKTMDQLQTYSWPGNIRELENLIERAVITSPDRHLVIPLPHESVGRKTDTKKTLEELERDHITKILDETYWRIQGPTGAATLLGLNPSTLRGRMRKLGIRRPGIVRHEDK